MSKPFKHLIGYKFEAKNGVIGKCTNFLIDSKFWMVHLIVTGLRNWLPGKKKLNAPNFFVESEDKKDLFTITLTKKQIKSSSLLETNKHVYKKDEIEMNQYYKWPGRWGMHPYPELLLRKNCITKQRSRYKKID